MISTKRVVDAQIATRLRASARARPALSNNTECLIPIGGIIPSSKSTVEATQDKWSPQTERRALCASYPPDMLCPFFSPLHFRSALPGDWSRRLISTCTAHGNSSCRDSNSSRFQASSSGCSSHTHTDGTSPSSLYPSIGCSIARKPNDSISWNVSRSIRVLINERDTKDQTLEAPI